MKLTGNRTYLTAGVAGAYLLGAKLGWWPLEQEVIAAFGALAAVFLRASIRNAAGLSGPPNPPPAP